MTELLIVDDNAEIALMLQFALQRKGYQVQTRRNGFEGLNFLQKNRALPAAVVSNLYMPQMDGLTFLQEVRRNTTWNDLPFIMMTAAPGDETRDAALTAGAQAYLSKPFDFDELADLLGSLGVSP